MTRDYEPVPEPEDGFPHRKAPKALRRLQKQFTYEKRIAKFREIFSRDPALDSELEYFSEQYLIELYNEGHDTV